MGLKTMLLLVAFTQPPQDVPVVTAEVAPPPRVAGPPAAMVAVPNGYEIRLNRRSAERLRDALENADEKSITGTLRDLAKQKREGAEPDADAAAKFDFAAFLVATQLPGFKKELADNMGPGGVTIRLTGLQAPAVPFKRPGLARAAEAVRGVMPLLPPDAQDAVEALRAMGRTTPLMWKVEPR